MVIWQRYRDHGRYCRTIYLKENAMLAMQYSFTLPADYEMSVIRERVSSKGALMDGFSLLRFKAFLHANRDQARRHARENLYAPFYLWESTEGMNNFLASSGFAALVASFGWPSIATWSVWASRLQPDLAAAVCATREIVRIEPHVALAELQKTETELVRADVDNYGALGAVVGFEPGTWTLVRFRLWSEYREEFDRAGVQTYVVGHLST
jgi:hypothetical protein